MRQYVCDNCEKVILKPEVVLKGIAGTSGSILMPELFPEKHFCVPECFWQWIETHRVNKD